MSDVNRDIEQWKHSLIIADSFSTENIEELESHLRDSMETLSEQGLSEKEAFLVARDRIGETAELTEEFSKENSFMVWGRRVLWMLMGIVIFQVGLQLNTIAVYLVSSLAVLFRLPLGFMNIASIVIRVGLTCLLVTVMIMGPMLYVKSQAIRNMLRGARKMSIIFGIAAVGVAIISMILPSVYYAILARLKGAEEVGGYLMFDQVFRYGYALLLVLIPIVGIIILDWVIRKKQMRMSVGG